MNTLNIRGIMGNKLKNKAKTINAIVASFLLIGATSLLHSYEARRPENVQKNELKAIHFGPGPRVATKVDENIQSGDTVAIHFGPGPGVIAKQPENIQSDETVAIHFGPGPALIADAEESNIHETTTEN